MLFVGFFINNEASWLQRISLTSGLQISLQTVIQDIRKL